MFRAIHQLNPDICLKPKNPSEQNVFDLFLLFFLLFFSHRVWLTGDKEAYQVLGRAAAEPKRRRRKRSRSWICFPPFAATIRRTVSVSQATAELCRLMLWRLVAASCRAAGPDLQAPSMFFFGSALSELASRRRPLTLVAGWVCLFEIAGVTSAVMNFLNGDICSQTCDCEPLMLSDLNKGQHKPVNNEPSEKFNWSCF